MKCSFGRILQLFCFPQVSFERFSRSGLLLGHGGTTSLALFPSPSSHHLSPLRRSTSYDTRSYPIELHQHPLSLSPPPPNSRVGLKPPSPLDRVLPPSPPISPHQHNTPLSPHHDLLTPSLVISHAQDGIRPKRRHARSHSIHCRPTCVSSEGIGREEDQ